ncbi:MAG TPA: hypothetical protein VKB86_02750 [Pyrinomonadaceae bacterium]|nr:hypothetical protein [Pyrinomonadaceae bacterium]
MINQSEESKLGLLRFDLNGSWTVGEFSNLLETIDTSYIRLSLFLFRSDEFDHHIRCFGADQIRMARPESFTPLLSHARRHTEDLRVRRLSLASPGFVEMVGNLNPIKIIADFIIAWRHENTVRDENTHQAELERMRIKAELAKLLIERAEHLTKGHPDAFMERLVEYVVDEPQKALTSQAKDMRITQVSWQEISQTEIAE